MLPTGTDTLKAKPKSQIFVIIYYITVRKKNTLTRTKKSSFKTSFNTAPRFNRFVSFYQC